MLLFDLTDAKILIENKKLKLTGVTLKTYSHGCVIITLILYIVNLITIYIVFFNYLFILRGGWRFRSTDGVLQMTCGGQHPGCRKSHNKKK